MTFTRLVQRRWRRSTPERRHTKAQRTWSSFEKWRLVPAGSTTSPSAPPTFDFERAERGEEPEQSERGQQESFAQASQKRRDLQGEPQGEPRSEGREERCRGWDENGACKSSCPSEAGRDKIPVEESDLPLQKKGGGEAPKEVKVRETIPVRAGGMGLGDGWSPGLCEPPVSAGSTNNSFLPVHNSPSEGLREEAGTKAIRPSSVALCAEGHSSDVLRSNLNDITSLLSVSRDLSLQHLCSEVSKFKPSVLQLGVSIAQLLLATPRDGDWLKSWIKNHMLKNFTSPDRGRDVLPLPLPPVGAAVKLLKKLQKTKEGLLVAELAASGTSNRQRKQQNKKDVVHGCLQVWRFVVTGVLSGVSSSWNLPVNANRGEPSATQKAAVENIDGWVGHFCKDPLAQVNIPLFKDMVASKAVDYSGEEACKALRLKLRELLPGLPVKGVAGSLCAAQPPGEGLGCQPKVGPQAKRPVA